MNDSKLIAGDAETACHPERTLELVNAAQAVVKRWHSTSWKDAPTAGYINQLERAVANMGKSHITNAAHQQAVQCAQATCDTTNYCRSVQRCTARDAARAQQVEASAHAGLVATTQQEVQPPVNSLLYAPLPDEPDGVCEVDVGHSPLIEGARIQTCEDGYSAAQMQEFADATHALRTQQPAPAAQGDEHKALAALRYYKTECSGAEPSMSVFHRMVDEALEAAPAAQQFDATEAIHRPTLDACIARLEQGFGKGSAPVTVLQGHFAEKKGGAA